MTVLDWLLAPIRAVHKIREEIRDLHNESIVKLAVLHAEIESGKVTGSELDAVTECLENIQKKKETDRLRKEGKNGS